MKRSKKSFKSIKSKRKRIPKQRKKIKHTESPGENIPEILSPKNTTQYLISNNSSSFYPEEDDDLDLNINNPFAFQIEPYEKIIQKQNQNIEKKLPSLELELVSTSAQSQDVFELNFSYQKEEGMIMEIGFEEKAKILKKKRNRFLFF